MHCPLRDDRDHHGPVSPAPRRVLMQFRAPLSLLLVLSVACGGGDGGGGGHGEPVLEVTKWTPSGENQTDTVGQTLPRVLRVKVTLDGELASGITVNFSGGNLGTPSMVTGV